jgi:uncharacterized iron-regulated protein
MRNKRGNSTAWGMAILLVVSIVAYLAPLYATPNLPARGRQILRGLAAANVVYLGETHDRPADRADALTILDSLTRQRAPVAIGMEMFQRPFQGTIDRYLAGRIDEGQLQQETEFQTRWGYPWESYARVLRFAKQKRLPVIALNVPTEITRKVARNGLESLSGDDLLHIVPPGEIDFSDDRYRATLEESYRAHASTQSNSRAFDRFHAAQLLWDETMAESIFKYLQKHPRHRFVVLAGRGHITYGHGIPNRVARRIRRGNIISRFVQKIVLLSSENPIDPQENPPIADYVFRDL